MKKGRLYYPRSALAARREKGESGSLTRNIGKEAHFSTGAPFSFYWERKNRTRAHAGCVVYIT